MSKALESDTEDIKSIVVAGRKALDPFDLRLSWAQLTTREKDQLLDLIESRYSELIREAFKGRQKAVVAILCGGKIVKVDDNFTSLEQLQKLEEEHGAICVPVVNWRKFMVEESVWSDLTEERRGDYYPTVPIVIGNELWSAPTIFNI